MKFRLPSPTTVVGALLYSAAGAAIMTGAAAVLHHVHVHIFWS